MNTAKNSREEATVGHVTHGSIFDDLGYGADKARSLKIRAGLMNELIAFIETQGWNQTEAGERLGVAQGRVSLLLRGKISKFTIDALVDMQEQAGIAGESEYLQLAGEDQ